MGEHQRRTFPYWKIQYWDTVTHAWMDIQKKYLDEDEAWRCARVMVSDKVRIMRIDRDGRAPVPHSVMEVR